MVGEAVSPAITAIRPACDVVTVPRGVTSVQISPDSRERGRSSTSPWVRVASNPLASRLTISTSVPPARETRLADNSNTARAFGSVQKELPEATGKFIEAGVHWVSPAVW